MDKTLHSIFNGAFGWVKGPLLCFLMLCIVVSLVRHPPGRLVTVRSRNPRLSRV